MLQEFLFIWTDFKKPQKNKKIQHPNTKINILVVQRKNNQIYNDKISVLANLFSCVFSFPHLQFSDMNQKIFQICGF